MLLRNNLYTIMKREDEGMAASYVVKLNPSSFIYQAHFPGEPITPGVCIVQMGKELLEDFLIRNHLAKDAEIISVKNVKFLSVISPEETDVIVYQIKRIEISEDKTKVKSQIVVTSKEEPKAKISLVLRVRC